MARAPFSFFLRNTRKGKVWYERYLNPDSEQYDITKSTGVFCVGKKGRKHEAYEWAREKIQTRKTESQKFITYLEAFWAVDGKMFYRVTVTGFFSSYKIFRSALPLIQDDMLPNAWKLLYGIQVFSESRPVLLSDSEYGICNRLEGWTDWGDHPLTV